MLHREKPDTTKNGGILLQVYGSSTYYNNPMSFWLGAVFLFKGVSAFKDTLVPMPDIWMINRAAKSIVYLQREISFPNEEGREWQQVVSVSDVEAVLLWEDPVLSGKVFGIGLYALICLGHIVTGKPNSPSPGILPCSHTVA